MKSSVPQHPVQTIMSCKKNENIVNSWILVICGGECANEI